jgi:gliding motility-associated-like protein
MKSYFNILLFNTAIHFFATGQDLFNQSSIFISPSGLLSVKGSVVNNNLITNNGDLRVGGAWTNNAQYDAGTGKINFYSNQVQTINHNDQTFGKLIISGTGEKQFNANITITAELDLQSSILRSVNGAKLILNQGSLVKGGSNQSHVVGPVQTKGSGNWLFPIGNGTVYLPVEITNVPDANSVATLSLNELVNGQTLSGDVELEKLSSKRYWELIANGSNLSSAKIKLPMNDEGGLTDNLDLLTVVGSINAIDSYVSLGRSELVGDLASGFISSEEAPVVKFYSIAVLKIDRGIEIFNGVSVGDDAQNDFFRIRNIEFYPNNRVIIYNRWGDRIFDMPGYNNNQNSFKGESNLTGNKVTDGTYFYSIDLGNGTEKITGYLVVK